MSSYFSLPVFLVLFREATEASIIVSVLLSYINHLDCPKQSGNFKRQVWIGTIAGFVLSLVCGGIFVIIWNVLQRNLWSDSEAIWEGGFSLVASILIAVMGIAMLNTSRLKDKWEAKINKAVKEQASESTLQIDSPSPLSRPEPHHVDSLLLKSKAPAVAASKFSKLNRGNLFFWLPFITLLREGAEGIVFMFGLSLGQPPASIPLAVISGILAGSLIGFIMYKSGNRISLHNFFVGTAIVLYVIAAGLFSNAVYRFESYHWNSLIQGVIAGDDVAIPSYDIRTNVWVLEWGSPNTPGSGWQLLSVLTGWNNIASVATVLAYCFFWIGLSLALVGLKLKNRRSSLRENKDIV